MVHVFLDLFLCECVSVCVSVWPEETRRWCQTPWSCNYRWLWATLYGDWGPNQDRQEYQTLLTAEPSFQPQNVYIKLMNFFTLSNYFLFRFNLECTQTCCLHCSRSCLVTDCGRVVDNHLHTAWFSYVAMVIKSTKAHPCCQQCDPKQV